jgi:hypothetical protein
LISFLLACGLVGLLGQTPKQHDGAGLRPVPTIRGPLARTPEQLAHASFNIRRPEACQ